MKKRAWTMAEMTVAMIIVIVLSYASITSIKTTSNKKFYQQFEGKNPNNFVLKVKNDGGNIDAITAATISSRAYCDAVNKAYNILCLSLHTLQYSSSHNL